MRTFLKVLAALGGALLLIIGAVAIAVWTIDLNDFVAPIQKRVKEATGRDLSIGGGIDLKLSLEPKLVLDDVSLGNAPWAKEPQMLTAKSVEVQVALLPLLQRRFEVQRFRLVDPVIALETDAHGQPNWEFSRSPGGPAGGTTAMPGAGAAMGAFAIGDFAITNGTLTYLDGTTGRVTNVAIDGLSVHARDAQSPVSAQFRGQVDGVSLALEGDLGPLETLIQRRWPYPVSMHGEINGQKASLATKLRVADGVVGLDEIDLAVGSTKMTGKVGLVTGATRPKLLLNLQLPTFAATDLASLRTAMATAGAAALSTPSANSGQTAVAPGGKGASKRSAYIFPDDPIAFDVLLAYDADGDVSIGQLTLPDGLHLADMHAKFTVRDGRLDAPELQVSGFGGAATGHLAIDAAQAQNPAIALRVDGKDIDLAQVLAAIGRPGEVRGGKTQLTVDVTTHGVSPRQWVSGVNGLASAVVGPATLTNSKLDLDSALNRLTVAINPFHNVDPSTELQCAVFRLPLHGGIATIDRSLALETKKVGILASGSLDFRNETLDLSFRPQIRHGIPIDMPQVAELVRFEGPFTAPGVRIDAVASAATLVRIGAAVETGGLSVVGESLLKRSAAGGAGPCEVALGRGPASSAGAPAGPASGPLAPALGAVGKALRQVFNR